jgi:hypothetical protein
MVETTLPSAVQQGESWSGWYRRTPRAQWRLFCRAATEQAVWAILLRHAPSGDKLIRLGDANPNRDARPR